MNQQKEGDTGSRRCAGVSGKPHPLARDTISVVIMRVAICSPRARARTYARTQGLKLQNYCFFFNNVHSYRYF